VFGKYKLSLQLKEKDIEITIDGRGKRRRYYRKVGEEEEEKYIYAENGEIVICPVEPVNLPKEGTAEHLLIELEKSIVIEPNVKDSFYVKFPIEIGVFLIDKTDVERIDIFTRVKPKYILYGSPESGIICRWWKSNVYNDVPEVDRTYEGVMKVDIKNSYKEWVEIKKLVFRAFDMKIFYDGYAYMHSQVEILKKLMGETSFIKRRPKGMKESIDIYLAKGIKRFEKKFVMEWGFK